MSAKSTNRKMLFCLVCTNNNFLMTLKVNLLQIDYNDYSQILSRKLAICSNMCFNTDDLVCLIKFYDYDKGTSTSKTFSYFDVQKSQGGQIFESYKL